MLDRMNDVLYLENKDEELTLPVYSEWEIIKFNNGFGDVTRKTTKRISGISHGNKYYTPKWNGGKRRTPGKKSKRRGIKKRGIKC